MTGSRPRALVTGGAVRVGRSIVEALAAAGYDVVIHFHASAEAAAEVAETVAAQGAAVSTVAADLSDPAQIAVPFDAAVRAFGGLDLLVNSAAIFPRVDARAATAEDWDEVFALNARAAFLCCVEAAERMDEGSIVNIVDTGASQAWPAYVPYVASKAALASVTKGLAAAFAPRIRVNGVAPGPVLLPEGADDAEEREKAARRTALARVGTPGDVAKAVLYLAGASYVTGEILRVDGGQHLRGR
jgi:pteridine reductase